jgi:peptidoglycan hydrolase CwlO-like protein
MMNLTSKERTTSLATVALCIAIGVMAMLFAVYYVNAINNQNQSNDQLATLRAQNADLQNQIASRNSQISSLNAQISSLTTQSNTLTMENQDLQGQVNQLTDTVNALAAQLAQMQAANGGGGGGRVPLLQ